MNPRKIDFRRGEGTAFHQNRFIFRSAKNTFDVHVLNVLKVSIVLKVANVL